MAELSISGTGPQVVRDEDKDFEPSADMLVHDFDDEQTMEEEEKLQGETNFNNEIDDLTREGEMPLHELLKMYGYGAADSAEEEDEGIEEPDVLEDEQSSDVKGKTKEDGGRKSCDQEEDHQSSSEESADFKRIQSTTQLLCSEPSSYFYGNDADESEDEDYVPSEEWKKEVKVGPMYQAETPAGLCKYEEDEKAYENEDQLLWNPELLPEDEVEEFLTEASKRENGDDENGGETRVSVVPTRSFIKDNEQALFELVKCNFNKDEALKSLKDTTCPAKEVPSVWTEEEHDDFDHADEANGTDVVAEDKQMKLWRRKPNLHPGATNSMEQNSMERNLGEGGSTEFSQTGSAGDAKSTAHNGLNSQLIRSSSDSSTSSSNTKDVQRPVRQLEEEEQVPERPLKKQKTEVEFLTSAAV